MFPAFPGLVKAMTRVTNGVGLTGGVQLRSHPLGCVCLRCAASEARLKHRSSDTSRAGSAGKAESAAALHQAQAPGAVSSVEPLKSTPTVTEVADPQRQEATADTAQAPAEGARNPYQDQGPAPGSQLSVKA